MSLGEILIERRREKKVEVEAAAQALKINVRYLQALENGEYHKLPKGIYGKSFLREYCYYLKLDYQKMLKLYEREESLFYTEEKKKDVFSQQRPKGRYFFSLPKLLRNIILIVVILACFIFLGYRVRKVIAPPILEISFPPENYITEEMKIEVIGQSEKEVSIVVNEQEIISDNLGKFKQEINLKEGMNIIRVRAEKRYGRDTEVVRQVLVK